MLQKWQLVEEVVALVFDTTSSNSGWRNGAAQKLECFLEKKVFYHACRHHVYELIVKAVWQAIFGEKTTGPENSHFYQLKTKWSLIDKNKSFKQISVPDILQSEAEQAAEKLKKMLMTKGSQFRADYRQCAMNA